MTCLCEDKCAGKLPPKAIEIVEECGPVLFHKVPYPASLGVPTDEELRALQYKNVLLEVEANGYVYLYSSDGVPTLISKGDIDPTEILEAISELQQSLAAETSAREGGDTNLQEQLTGLSDTVDEELNAVHATTTALQNDVAALQGTTVQKDTAISADASTVTVTKTTGELSTEGTETAMPLPVASAEQAGVMNASTFSAVRENSENIDSILGGAITLSTIPADPTQEQLTDAWKTATGKTELVNRASIYDETNKLVWYYYANASEWKSMPAGDAVVSVSIATNDTAGIVKGSTEDGQVAVEADGTMSLNGYDAINSNIENLQSEMPKLPAGMVYNFVSPAGANNPSTEDNAKITVRVVNTTTGAISNSALMMPMASETQAGSITAADKSKLNNLGTDTPNLAQVRSATVGDVLYSGTGAEATITLASPVSQYEKVEIIGSWTMPHTDVATPLQVIGHWHLNDQDNSRTFQLRAVDVDPATSQKTEVVETWSFTGSTTLQMVSGAQIAGELTDQVMEALEAPQIIITKVIGIKAI